MPCTSKRYLTCAVLLLPNSKVKAMTRSEMPLVINFPSTRSLLCLVQCSLPLVSGFHCPTHGDFKVADAVFAEAKAKAKDYHVRRDPPRLIFAESNLAAERRPGYAGLLARSLAGSAPSGIFSSTSRAAINLFALTWPTLSARVECRF
jgi:hypothetical protein